MRLIKSVLMLACIVSLFGTGIAQAQTPTILQGIGYNIRVAPRAVSTNYNGQTSQLSEVNVQGEGAVIAYSHPKAPTGATQFSLEISPGELSGNLADTTAAARDCLALAREARFAKASIRISGVGDLWFHQEDPTDALIITKKLNSCFVEYD